MKLPIPTHAVRIEIGGQTAFLWRTKDGWSILQGPYQVDLENVERDGQRWHTIDWSNRTPREGFLEGGLAQHEPDHLDQSAFIPLAEGIVAALRRR